MIYEGKQTEHDEGGFNYDESVMWIIRLIKDGSEAGFVLFWIKLWTPP